MGHSWQNLYSCPPPPKKNNKNKYVAQGWGGGAGTPRKLIFVTYKGIYTQYNLVYYMYIRFLTEVGILQCSFCPITAPSLLGPHWDNMYNLNIIAFPTHNKNFCHI